MDGKPVTDQWLPPFVIEEDGKPVGTIEDGDAVVRTPPNLKIPLMNSRMNQQAHR